MKYDAAVIGAGMTGAAAARALAESGLRTLVLEAREHVGGNCRDAPDERGICVHPYGPHIFHTSRREAVEFLSRFTAWRPYEHRVTASARGRLIPLPFNLTSLSMCFSAADAARMEEALLRRCGPEGSVPVLELRGSGEACLRDLADFVYEEFFLGYTQKQWGLAPTEINPGVTARVPVRASRDDRYFLDAFQRMPKDGFTPMFERMLDHPEIVLSLNAPFAPGGAAPARVVICTGPIDEYFGRRLGALPYRSLDFDFQHYAQPRHLPSAVLNFPDVKIPWTRIAEYRQITGQEAEGTSVSLEYPRPHEPGRTIPFYPVFTEDAAKLHDAYRALAREEAPNTVFAGRLGAFRYLNMDEAALAGLEAAREARALLGGPQGGA